MEWKLSACGHYIEAAAPCGRYTITKSTTPQAGPLYAAWSPRPNVPRTAPWQDRTHHALLYSASREACQHAAAQHAAAWTLCSFLYRLSAGRSHATALFTTPPPRQPSSQRPSSGE